MPLLLAVPKLMPVPVCQAALPIPCALRAALPPGSDPPAAAWQHRDLELIGRPAGLCEPWPPAGLLLLLGCWREQPSAAPQQPQPTLCHDFFCVPEFLLACEEEVV